MFGLNNIISIAVYSVLSKFSEDLKDYNKNKFTIFDLSEMICNELVNKHGYLFIEDYTKNLINIKDFEIGKKNIWLDNTN